jgi:hypothetical protein
MAIHVPASSDESWGLAMVPIVTCLALLVSAIVWL